MNRKNMRMIFFLMVFTVIYGSCAHTPNAMLPVYTEEAATMMANIQSSIEAALPTEAPVMPTTEALINHPGSATNTPIILDVKLRNAALIPTLPAIPAVTQAMGNVSPGGFKDSAQFVSFWPSDNVTVKPGEAFNLSVVLKNTGTTTWNTRYNLVFASGTNLSYAPSFPIADTAPNTNYTGSIYMTAPAANGTYVSTWYLQDAYKVNFFSFTFNLNVGDHSSITSVPTMKPTITLTPAISNTPGSKLAYACTDPERSRSQGEGCAGYCPLLPRGSICFVNGNPYIWPTDTIAPTQTPNLAATETVQAGISASQTAQAQSAYETALAQTAQAQSAYETAQAEIAITQTAQASAPQP